MVRMMFAAVFLIITVTNLSHALDDDDPDADQKYSVQFFQFNPQELALPGFAGRGGHKKKFVKRSDTAAETVSPSVNATVAAVNTTDNATVANNSPAVGSVAASPVDNNNSANTKRDSITESDVKNMDDRQIMHHLINQAIKKLNASQKRSHIPADPRATIGITGTFESSNTSVLDPKITLDPKDGKSKKSDITYEKDALRKDALNPNPKPSEDEALLNLKHPKQLENKPHDSNIHSENTSKVTETEDKHAETTNMVTMEKTNESPNENVTATNETASVMVPTNKTNTVMNTSTPTTPEDAEKAKLEKDKQTNKEILENAKDIQPIQDTVGQMNMTIHESTKDDTIGKEVKETSTATDEKQKEPEDKKKDLRSKVTHLDEEGKKKHRKIASKFVPLYKTSAKDHKLSFQIGAMKHPKHNIHPKCHACPQNSTYKDCVKKSTLLECNKGLDNICFTKSSKKDGIITYQMGCSNHNQCVAAKAFPCKDDREKCFTCCQFDRCNSSPHHGDYELDDVNLAELSDSVVESDNADNKDTVQLDSTSATDNISGSWLLMYASTFIALLFLQS